MNEYTFICEDCDGDDEPCVLTITLSNEIKTGPTRCPFDDRECDWRKEEPS